MSTKTNESTPKAFVSDERINDARAMFKKLKALSYDEHVAEPFAEGHTQGSVWMRSIYEPHVQQLVRERDEAVAKAAWIPVSERLPELNKMVLVTDGTSVLETSHNGKGFKMPRPFPPGMLVDVTHWMHLPSPPNTPPSNG